MGSIEGGVCVRGGVFVCVCVEGWKDKVLWWFGGLVFIGLGVGFLVCGCWWSWVELCERNIYLFKNSLRGLGG